MKTTKTSSQVKGLCEKETENSTSYLAGFFSFSFIKVWVQGEGGGWSQQQQQSVVLPILMNRCPAWIDTQAINIPSRGGTEFPQMIRFLYGVSV